jgi:type I restriction-modification system DNA methylase subunit
MEQPFEGIKQLVADFKAQEAAYLSPSYQESQVRQDFIDKFFTALGWDVTHERQKNPYEQEVHIENKVKMAGSSQRRADYAFYLSPNFRDPKFFVEAKKPSRNLANADDYYQAIRYGWNAKTPLAILTDFEEFHILDCRFKPDINDALNRKVAAFHYTDYADNEKFAYINYLFSRDAVAAGAIDKRATELPKPRGKGGKKGASRGAYQAVDEAFLEELDEYRITLAKAFKKANEKLEGEELTEAVQRTIDRLVFIRFLEDKGIEEKAIINLKGQKSAWKAFINLCKRCEPKYNGLVFKPHRVLDNITLDDSEDKAFALICAELADPGSPYDFNQIPISILGSIYERFLGKVVHATDKRVKVEEKPEVRKAGGVYYTPEYIVRYIVKETVGKLIEGKTPTEIAPMAFADIACGSGSFLIEVYAQLLEHHVRYYLANRDKAKTDEVFERDGQLHLSLKKKKEILLNNIYGVDIDFQATEVTQLSLYLKLLEDATLSEAHQFGLFKETILPDLKQNVVCGNSLVENDVDDGALFPENDVAKLKPMRPGDVFPRVIKRGGFDAIVGNPPYRMIQPHNTEPELIDYMRKHFAAAEFKVDLFHLFLQRAVNLLRQNAFLGYIVPSTILNNVYTESLRKWLMERCEINSIAVAPGKVFENADVHTCVIVFSRQVSSGIREKKRILTTSELSEGFSDDPNFHSSSVQGDFQQLPGCVWNILVNETNSSLVRKLIWQNVALRDLANINRGLITGDRQKYFSASRESKDYVPIVAGGDVQRYYVNPPSEFVLFVRPESAGGCWDEDVHLAPHKVVVRQIGTGPTAGILQQPVAVTGNIFTVMGKTLEEEMYLLGLINSRIADFFWRVMFNDFKTSFPQVTIFSLGQLPIRKLDRSSASETKQFDTIVKLVGSMIDLKHNLSIAKTDAEKNRLELQCESLDRQIDEAVYELYGLTAEEIRIVEGE